MARIRTIKPEFWTSEQVMECSPMTRLLFIGLWNFCDDVGRMALSPKRIKAQVLPSDDVTASDVLGMLQELSANGLIRFYTVDEKDYLAVTGWSHQRIDKPQKALTPDPPDPHSPNDPGKFGVGREKEKEKDRKRESPGPAVAHPARPTLNEASPAAAPTDEAAGRGQAEGWNTRANFDRVLKRVVEALGTGSPQDLRIGSIARLEADGLDLEAEIIPNLLDIAAASRTPIRTWAIYADRVAERVALQRLTRAQQGLAATPAAPVPQSGMVDLGSPFGAWAEDGLRLWVTKHHAGTATWPEHLLGPAPGSPGCRIPSRLMLEAA